MKRSLLFLSLLSAFPSYAEQFPNNECALIVASRQTMDEVKDYINENISDRRYLRIYKASNGWNAISIGMLKPNEVEPVMTKWKESGKIPQDSFCANGVKLNEEIDLSGNIITDNSFAKVTKKDFYYIENNKLTKADLKDYSKGQLRLLRNYFFAKKGYAFKEGSDLDIFFKQFSWYSPKEILSTDIYDNQLKEQEKNNISLLWAVEKGEDLDKVHKSKDNQPKNQVEMEIAKVEKYCLTANRYIKNNLYSSNFNIPKFTQNDEKCRKGSRKLVLENDGIGILYRAKMERLIKLMEENNEYHDKLCSLPNYRCTKF
ncbi:YARHG domain-containing protein [Phocoenobacter skyensis]|uniref:YARHG domain-containing protein n=1 Tax=Phocoenobacter skyensis TaxID=97481 RepID=A0AAJ6NC84_9PAST|nr:YARHG domain-containing protein [Pasteurella skyensis]MDP8174102.1 YARHG domain-containing protein [Pasteurella skyensis]